MAFKYKPRTREQMETRKNASQHDFVSIFKDGVKVYQVKEGQENAIRIMPPTWEDAEHYGLDAHIHYSVGPDRVSVLCLAKHKGKPCPVCEERAKLQARGDEDEAKELRPGKAVVLYVVDRDNEAEGVQAWRAPFSVDADIMKLCVDSRTGETYNIDDPDQGYDVFFSVEGKMLQRKYKGIKLDRKPTKVASKFLKKVEENPLTEALNFLTYKEIVQVMGGGSPAKKNDDDDEDDRRPAKSSRRARDEDDEDEPAPKKAVRRSRDDDDDDDDEPAPKKRRSSARDDDDDEDEPPRKSRSRARDDDDDEDEDEPAPKKRKAVHEDDEDDEDETPPPKRKASRDDDDDEDDDVPFDKGKKVKEEPKSSVRTRLASRSKR